MTELSPQKRPPQASVRRPCQHTISPPQKSCPFNRPFKQTTTICKGRVIFPNSQRIFVIFWKLSFIRLKGDMFSINVLPSHAASLLIKLSHIIRLRPWNLFDFYKKSNKFRPRQAVEDRLGRGDGIWGWVEVWGAEVKHGWIYNTLIINTL